MKNAQKDLVSVARKEKTFPKSRVITSESDRTITGRRLSGIVQGQNSGDGKSESTPF